MLDRLADFRRVYAQMVVARAGHSGDAALLDAFATVERHVFLGAGPWAVREDGTNTSTDDPALAYQDVGIGVAPGVPNGLPSLHARLLATAGVKPGDVVMQVGAGTGYFTAILAELVGSSGRVYAFEIDEALATRARKNLTHWSWIEVQARSGVCVPPEPVTLVYVNAGVQQLPAAWLDAVKPRGGGVMFPLVAGDGEGAVFFVRHHGAIGWSAQLVTRARFVPCIGTQDEAASARLANAFRGPSCEHVRSLRRAPDLPDETAWFAGDGWWLSVGSPG